MEGTKENERNAIYALDLIIRMKRFRINPLPAWF